MKKDELEKLAQLARLELSEDEGDRYANEIGDILGYVKQVQNAAAGDLSLSYNETITKNVFRSDENPDKPGVYTDDILNQAPDTKNGFIQVKKIIDND